LLPEQALYQLSYTLKTMSNPTFQRWRETFMHTRELGPVHFEMSRDQLQELFGEPDDVAVTLPIVVYGGLEFHFDPAGLLWLIYRDSEAGVEVSITRPNDAEGGGLEPHTLASALCSANKAST
jgi:hypothetical protein